MQVQAKYFIIVVYVFTFLYQYLKDFSVETFESNNQK